MPGGGLTFASARHRTPYGEAESSWKIDQDSITVEVVVPPNTVARVTLPGKDEEPLEVGSGKHRWTYEFQNSKFNSPKLWLDITFDELIDHPAAHAVVMNILSQYNSELANRMDGQEGITLRQAAWLMPHTEELIARLEASLVKIER